LKSSPGAVHVVPPLLDVALKRPRGHVLAVHWMAPKNVSNPPPGMLTMAGFAALANLEAITDGDPTTPVDVIGACTTSAVLPPDPGVARVHTTCSPPAGPRTIPTSCVVLVAPVTGVHETAAALAGTTAASDTPASAISTRQ
jgi:hypothetical protein